MTISLSCAKCGQPAAIFKVFNAQEGEGIWKDRTRIERSVFMGSTIQFGEIDSLHYVLYALQRGDYEYASRKLGPDFIAFRCEACQLDYCEKCWDIGPPEFDDGFYDCTYGACPEGHTQTVDD